MSSEVASFDLYTPKFAPEWARFSLYPLAKWINGMAFKNIDFTVTGVPVIKISEIKNGVTDQTQFTQSIYDRKFFLHDGDMLFCWSGQPETSIGTYWWHGGDGWLNQHIFKVEPETNKIDRGYFYQLLQYLRPTFVSIARNKQTTGLGHVTKRDLQRLVVALPSYKEQQAIAKVLGSLDDKIESNRRIQLLSEQLVRAYVSEILNAAAPENGKLQDYCSLVKDTVKIADLREEDNYVGLEHMPRASLGLESWGNSDGLSSNKTRFQKGDILFGKLRPYFKKVVVAPIDGICSTDIIVIRAKRIGDIGLVAATAASDSLIEYVSSASTGTRMPRTSWNDIAKWQVPILNDEQRYQLSSKTSPLINKITQLTFENHKLILLRDTLLPELLSGRLHATSLPEEVPA
jgi:type I restriction enzyme S subunit